MAWRIVGVTTRLFLPTRLLACSPIVFASAGPTTDISAFVDATTKLLSADVTAANIVKPARLILELMPSTQARFGCEKWTLWAFLFIHVAIVYYWRMAAGSRSFALEAAWRRLCAARQRRMKNGSTAIAADFFKDGFRASVALEPVT